MPHRRPPAFFVLALILPTAAMSAPSAAQPIAVPRTPARTDEYSYRAALGALWNYGSCGIRAPRAAYQALAAELRAIESLARSKGLGPTLERVRDEYRRMLAVALLASCGGGPAGALTSARRAMADFRTWVEAAPAHRLTQAEVDAAAAQEVLAVDDAYAAAVLNHDEAAIRGILDAGFRFDPGDGRAGDGDGLLAMLRRLNLIHHRLTERTVAMRDGVGTVTGVALLASASATQPEVTRHPYVATYRRRGGVWRMTALHMSPEAEH